MAIESEPKFVLLESMFGEYACCKLKLEGIGEMDNGRRLTLTEVSNRYCLEEAAIYQANLIDKAMYVFEHGLNVEIKFKDGEQEGDKGKTFDLTDTKLIRIIQSSEDYRNYYFAVLEENKVNILEAQLILDLWRAGQLSPEIELTEEGKAMMEHLQARIDNWKAQQAQLAKVAVSYAHSLYSFSESEG